jgi:hypothetical protein
MKILFADNWHFHSRNFLPLFKAIQQDSLPHLFETSRSSWWKAHGCYSTHEKLLTNSLHYVDQHQDWSQINYQGINLWKICKAEFLCNALTQDSWHIGGIPNESEAVFKYAVANEGNRAALRLCLAATHDWLIFWSEYLDRGTNISHAIVFSGSYIYTRTLMVLAKERNVSILVAEHFFTGNDFYLEYRDNPIANNCGIQRKLGVDFSLKGNANDVVISTYMHSRIKGMRNRNAPKRNIGFRHPWNGRDPVILIIGQVVNDFSIIETPSNEVSSIAIYKQAFIDLLSNTSANLIFKAHPWERRRAPLFKPITKLKIEEFIRSLPEKDQLRIAVIENEPIQNIFQICDGVMGISSQGLLESCFYGFKPALLGKTFFSNKDFTQSTNEKLALIKCEIDKASWKLSLDEYGQFQNYMKEMFTEVLIPNYEEASVLITGKLSKSNAKLETKFMLDVIGTSRVDWMIFFRDALDRPNIWMYLLRIWIKSQFSAQS